MYLGCSFLQLTAKVKVVEKGSSKSPFSMRRAWDWGSSSIGYSTYTGVRSPQRDTATALCFDESYGKNVGSPDASRQDSNLCVSRIFSSNLWVIQLWSVMIMHEMYRIRRFTIIRFAQPRLFHRCKPKPKPKPKYRCNRWHSLLTGQSIKWKNQKGWNSFCRLMHLAKPSLNNYTINEEFPKRKWKFLKASLHVLNLLFIPSSFQENLLQTGSLSADLCSLHI